jgi:hypothetical protein
MENFKNYEQKRDAFNKAKEEFLKAESDLRSEILSKSKFKEGDKVVVIDDRESYSENKGKIGIVSNVGVPHLRRNLQIKNKYNCFCNYVLNKVTKSGAMHKTAKLDYWAFQEDQLELVSE